jgi:hypothetical protein
MIQNENIYADRIEWEISDNTLYVLRCLALYRRKKRGKPAEFIGALVLRELHGAAKQQYQVFSSLDNDDLYTHLIPISLYSWIYTSNGRKNKQFTYLPNAGLRNLLQPPVNWRKLGTDESVAFLKSHAICTALLEELMLVKLSI